MYKLNSLMLKTLSAQQPLMRQMVAARPFSFTWPCPRKLREVVKMSAFEKENADTCVYLWNEFHHSNPASVSTVLSVAQYKHLFNKGKSAPMFIQAVPKGAPPNHMILVSQAQETSFVFTYLGDFQANPTGANAYMVLTCYDELASTKGIVFMRGDLISHLDEDEGHVIMTNTLDRYLIDSEFEAVDAFNNDSSNFDYESHVSNSLKDFTQLKDHYIKNKPKKLELGKVKKYGHKTDAEMNFGKGSIIR
jgi:ATP synthase F1 complex assembly factor 1